MWNCRNLPHHVYPAVFPPQINHIGWNMTWVKGYNLMDCRGLIEILVPCNMDDVEIFDGRNCLSVVWDWNMNWDFLGQWHPLLSVSPDNFFTKNICTSPKIVLEKISISPSKWFFISAQQQFQQFKICICCWLLVLYQCTFSPFLSLNVPEPHRKFVGIRLHHSNWMLSNRF